MARIAALVVLFVAFLKPALANTSQASRDSRALSPVEIRTFLPLVCSKASRSPMSSAAFADLANFDCQRLIGYRDAGRGSIAFSAIVYRPFTGPGANEAYVSYLSEAEPHSNDDGGGILFRRSGERWRLLRWYPGRAMQKCLGLPSQGQWRMLCLMSHTGQGETDTSVWMEDVGSEPASAEQAVIKAQDDRGGLDAGEANTKSYPCVLGGHMHKAMLLSIDSLTRSTAAAELARSMITYAAAKDVVSACHSGHFESIRTKRGIMRYFLKDGDVIVTIPETFSKTDY